MAVKVEAELVGTVTGEGQLRTVDRELEAQLPVTQMASDDEKLRVVMAPSGLV